ncbi:hypothetical protein SNEBB_003267 [Seison nebaliae]|nr:hypothetical protein SNEBB_003267 [Seison nebaliae]
MDSRENNRTFFYLFFTIRQEEKNLSSVHNIQIYHKMSEENMEQTLSENEWTAVKKPDITLAIDDNGTDLSLPRNDSLQDKTIVSGVISEEDKEEEEEAKKEKISQVEEKAVNPADDTVSRSEQISEEQNVDDAVNSGKFNMSDGEAPSSLSVESKEEEEEEKKNETIEDKIRQTIESKSETMDQINDTTRKLENNMGEMLEKVGDTSNNIISEITDKVSENIGDMVENTKKNTNSCYACFESFGQLFPDGKVPDCVSDIFKWKDPIKSGSVLAVTLLTLLSFNYFSSITLFATIALVVLGLNVSYVTFKLMFQVFNNNQTQEHPYRHIMHQDFLMSDSEWKENFDRLHEVFLKVVKKIRKIFLVEDIWTSVKVMIICYLSLFIAKWFSGSTLIALVVIAAFTIPKTYEMYQSQIDSSIKQVGDKINDVKSKSIEKMPAIIQKSMGVKTA